MTLNSWPFCLRFPSAEMTDMPYHSWLILFGLDFEMKSHSVAQAHLELEAMLPLHCQMCWDHRQGPPHPAQKLKPLECPVIPKVKGSMVDLTRTILLTKPV